MANTEVFRCSTPVLTFNLDDENLDNMSEIHFAMKQGDNLIVKTTNDADVTQDGSTFMCEYSQAETLSLKNGSAYLQARIKYNDGSTFPTNIVPIQVLPVLQEDII